MTENLQKMLLDLKNLSEEELELLAREASATKERKNTTARIAVAGKVLAVIREYADTFKEKNFIIKDTPIIDEWEETVYEDLVVPIDKLFVNKRGFIEIEKP